MSLAWISHPRTNPFVTMAGGPELPQPTGSHAAMPQTSMVPSCHQVRLRPGRGKCSDFKGNSTKSWTGNIWAIAAWLVLCFVLLNDTVLWQCHAMSCDVSDIVISVTTDSHQPVLCPARRHWGSVGRIQSNVARYLDKPGLNMIPACWAATWPPYFRGHPAVMQTVRDGRRGLAILWPAPLGNQ